ncbi:MAG: MFS transporter [Planctomycetota bacterium]
MLWTAMRWLIVLATFLLSVLLYVDRVCISAAKDDVASDLGLSEIQMGWVFSAFALGYALMQTPSGWLADRLGPRRVLAAIVTVWSIFTGLTSVANSYLSMLAVRFLFGAGEAGAFPGMSRAVFSWIPMKERGRVQAINFSGSRLGAAVTLPLISWMILQFGWRGTFVALMGIGFVWAVAWFLFFRDEPTDAKWLPESERDFILDERQQTTSADETAPAETPRISVGILASSSTIWLICTQYFASNFVFFFGLTWFFPRLKERYDLTGMEASLFAAVPMLCGALGCWASGWWVDRLYSSGRWMLSRRLPAMVGFSLAAVGILGSAYATTPLTSSLLFSLCIFGADMTLPPSWTTCVDIGKSNAGVVSGTMNMAGNVGSFVTSLAFPYMLAWNNDSPLPYFYVAAGLNLAAVFAWLLINPSRPIGEQA